MSTVLLENRFCDSGFVMTGVHVKPAYSSDTQDKLGVIFTLHIVLFSSLLSPQGTGGHAPKNGKFEIFGKCMFSHQYATAKCTKVSKALTILHASLCVFHQQ